MKSIFNYEFKKWLTDWKYYMYLLFFSFGAFVIFAGTAGMFDPAPTGTTENNFLNSPFELQKIWNFLFKGILFLIPAIVGVTIYEDFRTKTHSVLFTYPIHKRDYLLGKFAAAISAVMLIIAITAVAIIMAEQLPGLHPDKIGAFNLLGHLETLFVYILPNVLIIGLILFSLVAYMRNIYVGFALIIVLFLIRNILPNALDNSTLLILMDPFGEFGFNSITTDWTRADKNMNLIPVTSLVIANRLMWLSIAIGVFAFVFKRFELHEQLDSRKKKSTDAGSKAFSIKEKPAATSMTLERSATAGKPGLVLWSLTRTNLSFILKNWMFYVLLVLGVLSVFFAITQVTNGQELAIMPVTNVVLSIPAFFFTLIITLLTMMYGGMLVNRDKASQMNFLVDSTPVSNTTLLLSKLFGLIGMQLVLLTVMMVVGIGIQLYNGYTHIEIGQYLLNLFFIQFIGLIIWAITSVFVHSLVRNTFLGIFILFVIWLTGSALPSVGFESRLMLFNFFEPLDYSDLYGYGKAFEGFALAKFYWFAVAMVFLVLTLLLVVRGQSITLLERFGNARIRINKPIIATLMASVIAIAVFGVNIYVHESAELSSSNQNKRFRQFTSDFEKYATIENQPKVTAMDLQVDLQPNANAFAIKGAYQLVNKSDQAIDTLLVKTGFDESTQFDMSVGFEVVEQDEYVKFYVLKLDQSLQPNDSLQFNFESDSKTPTVFDSNLEVVKSGSYFKNDLLPRFGYFLTKEAAEPSTPGASATNYYSKDSDLIDVRTTLSTERGQTAFAVGKLVDSWEEGDRSYYQYETQSSVKNSLSFLSGEYEVVEETHKGIGFKVSASPNHHYHSKSMIEALKASYDYNTRYFSPYQHDDAHIVEFPKTFGTYATLSGNLIPSSEIRFIANTAEGKVNLAFYVMAHEFAHNWWGNQVMPADALGAMMIAESVTEYVSLNIFRNYFGHEKALDWLDLQRGRYLKGRSRDNGREATLEMVPSEKQYLSYGKGAMTFNALAQHIGEDNLNAILQQFLLKYHSEKGVYPTSTMLIDHLDSNLPDSLGYLVSEGYRDIILHEISLDDVEIRNAANAQYDVEVMLTANKTSYLSEKGESADLHDYVQIGFYNELEELISLKTVMIDQTRWNGNVTLDEKPAKVVIDPHLLLIEKDIENNSFILKKTVDPSGNRMAMNN